MNPKERELRKKHKIYVQDCAEKGEIPDPFGIWCFINAKYEDLKPYAKLAIDRNQKEFAEMSKWVNGEVGGELLNPEYLKRAELTKQFKDLLAGYAGYKEIASDLLFQLKQACDADGRDFMKAAEMEVEKMKGDLLIEHEDLRKRTYENQIYLPTGNLWYCNFCSPICAGHRSYLNGLKRPKKKHKRTFTHFFTKLKRFFVSKKE